MQYSSFIVSESCNVFRKGFNYAQSYAQYAQLCTIIYYLVTIINQHSVYTSLNLGSFAQYEKNPKFSKKNPLTGLSNAAPQAKGVRLDKIAKLIDIRGAAMGGRLS